MTTHIFGLRNQRGSCWINATVQALLRIPDLQARFTEDEADGKIPVEMCLQELWASKGEEGLHDFYECVRTTHMPAGEGIGDSHELLELLCDKIPFLDKLMRFKVANRVTCSNSACSYTDITHDTLIEFSISPSERKQTITRAILEAVKPYTVPDWTCDACKGKGCSKQLMIAGRLPQVLVFHQTSIGTSASYSAVLEVNSVKYALIAIVCFNGGHWYTYGRDMPPGSPWYEFDDSRVRKFDASHFPLADTMRLLMYYRLNE
jgi:ubiquitin C-terminal hydrolase